MGAVNPLARPTVNRAGYNYKVRSSGLADLSRLRMTSTGVHPRANYAGEVIYEGFY